jgi:hypothetical protein|tara:strand:+ start:815 stop:1204 length:390 start_codon:yes stop_codon:yes gene_type:complete
MNSYHEIERFQRKAGQADFPFRHTGAPAFEHRETGWRLIDQVAAGVSPSSSEPSQAATFRPSMPVPPEPDDSQAQDVALERFASLLQARHRREVEHDHPEAGDAQSLKQLLRRIAVGPAETNERWPTRC